MYYYIRVQGHLDTTWSEWLDGMSITNAAKGETVLAGELVDQAALYGVLNKVRDLGLPLLTVRRHVARHGSDHSVTERI
jgi:hypothetical protein